MVAWYDEAYDIPQAHKDDSSLSAYNCPICRKNGHWRSGVHFEHQKRCGGCNQVWCPYDIEEWRQARAMELENQDGAGI